MLLYCWVCLQVRFVLSTAKSTSNWHLRRTLRRLMIPLKNSPSMYKMHRESTDSCNIYYMESQLFSERWQVSWQKDWVSRMDRLPNYRWDIDGISLSLVYLSVYLYFCSFVLLFVCSYILSFFCLFVNYFVYFVLLFVLLFACLLFCLFVWLFVCSFILFIYLFYFIFFDVTNFFVRL